jgi:hypothetical protein
MMSMLEVQRTCRPDGYSKIENTVRFLDVDIHDALTLAERI